MISQVIWGAVTHRLAHPIYQPSCFDLQAKEIHVGYYVLGQGSAPPLIAIPPHRRSL